MIILSEFLEGKVFKHVKKFYSIAINNFENSGPIEIAGEILDMAFWTGVVFALFVAIWASIIINMGSRSLGDMKIGIGAEYVPINVIYYKMDDQSNGIWSFPVADNPILPAAFGVLPSNWIQI